MLHRFARAIMLVSDSLAARSFATTSRDHRLPFHGFQLSAATPLWRITERHRSYRGGQRGKVIDLLARRCLPRGHPCAASGACAVQQISSSWRQCSEQQASLKAALGIDDMGIAFCCCCFDHVGIYPLIIPTEL